MMDTPDYTSDTVSQQTCRRVVRELVEKYDWALLQENDLLELVLASVQSGASLADLERLAKHHYTIALYEACQQVEDPHRRERAYHELFRYLFRAAYNRWPELAEDATQRALVLVYEQIDCCQHPGTFLAFALWKLRHAFQQEQRARGKEWTDWTGETDRGSAEEHSATSPPHLDQKERLQTLIEAIRCLSDERQQKTILLKFFGGLSDEEIGAYLGITVGNVRVLRHRGMARLRKDEQLRDYFEVANDKAV